MRAAAAEDTKVVLLKVHVSKEEPHIVGIETSIRQIRDPKPAVERVEVLATRIREGDILLPKFQRDFVWDRQQILDLLDSIAKNYPIGSVLLWLSRQHLRSEKSIAGLQIADRDPEYPVNYLLDGQQRLSCICGVLYWDGKDKDSIWNIAYDLKSETFVHLCGTDDPPLTQVRLNKLPDPTAFFQHVASLDILGSNRGLFKERATSLFNRFKDYTIATVTINDMPIDSVAPIFERINSTGTRLTIVDLMRAATWSEEFDLIDTIDGEVLEAISEKGFGGIERKAVLRNISAAAGGGFSAESIDHLRNRSARELRDAAQETVEAYKKVTDFLKDEVGAPNDSIIPYANQVVVLAELFRVLPNPTARQYAAIRRWFWRTTLSGYFSGWNTGQMASDLASVRVFKDGKDELEVAAPKPSADIWRTRQFRTNNAHAKMLGLMLAQENPLDLYTGQKIALERALSWTNVREYHHFFPQAWLKKTGITGNKANAIANFVLLTSSSNKLIADKCPSEYIREIQEAHGDERVSQIMRSNIISEAAMGAAARDDYEQFLNERAKTLHEHALALCGWV